MGDSGGVSYDAVSGTLYSLDAIEGSTLAEANNIILGQGAGYGVSGTDTLKGTVAIGWNAGAYATDVQYSNFIGFFAGRDASSASYSNFFGYSAGRYAANANYSNFFGQFAGQDATNASFSNFLGPSAGQDAVSAYNSNFFGNSAGYGATNANLSNFFGPNAGYGATNAISSNFFGNGAGYGAVNANNSIFIGESAGYNDTVNNSTLGYFSILIGPGTSTGGYSNSIALGSHATNTATNQFMIGASGYPIDITRINGSASTQCTITTGTGIACTSDERLKTDITDLPQNTLDVLRNVRTVTYHWLENPDTPEQIGFLAQDLEQYFPQLVATDDDGMKSVYYAQMTPILTEAVRELDLKITNIESFATATNTTFKDQLIAWLGDVANGVTKIFAHEVQTDKLCVGQTCLTEDQLLELMNNQNISSSLTPDPVPTDPNPAPEPTPDPDPIPTPEPTPEPTPDPIVE